MLSVMDIKNTGHLILYDITKRLILQMWKADVVPTFEGTGKHVAAKRIEIHIEG